MRPALNLDALLESDLSVILDGKPTKVLPIDGIGYQLAASVAETKNVEGMYKVAARCLPDLPEERVYRMTIEQINAVVEVASGTAKQVEATASPNSAPAGSRKLKRA